ncbi:hypothetical protein GSI_13581 [Ganoderma sinense ZZ0214-1]|uniref:Uncharacterized protein n=1 Tax=Ganoderma sinense ZZ0214-1 TaxID=1077348 RepID=A0A2G8RQP0_9APHY|nr:hypothetical protein GSI_13581 [Ganoderma sinense ZZ0214-1]
MPSTLRALSPGSSLASCDFFSAQSHSQRDNLSSESGDSDSYGTLSDDGSSDDDEILLSFSDLSSADFLSQRGAYTPAIFSDDEFVLMSRPRSPESDDLTASFSALSLSRTSSSHGHRRFTSRSSADSQNSSQNNSLKKRNRKRRAAAAPGNAGTSDEQVQGKSKGDPINAKPKHHSPSKARRKARRAAARAAAATPTAELALAPAPLAGFGDRPIVDDVSEAGSEYSHIPPELYQSAQRYVSSVLSAPTDVTTDMPSKLAFLQALIIELGLYTSMPSLPNSLRAAKAILKSQVFLNVRDYLAVRQQGVEALRGVMHPSRSALLREIRGGKKAPVKTVKDSGLGVLLVTCYR